MDKWENTLEIDGMKFTVKCYYGKLDTGYSYDFIAYNTVDEPVANTIVLLDREPTIEDFEKEIAPPSLKKLQLFITRKYVSSEFMTLDASKIHERTEKIDNMQRDTLKKEWQTFVANNIRKAADAGEFAVNVLHDRTMSGDNIFEGRYDRELMLVDTPKILEEKGFKVRYFENTNGGDPTAFTMTISW